MKTIRIDGKNKTMVVKTLGSDRYSQQTHDVTDAKKWALDPKGWSVSGSRETFDISRLDPEADKDAACCLWL